ncbi:MAG: hypothetical protein KJ936_06670 [Proteobacteria bacterium]|nr:hypothetical protein [Pseudomonadota bacterium]MBU2227337.1 hypothetical protein [Pseudomonadota bacterium]MBU2264514.1 hypothetical protein [Patescibacteria group bacterium]
MTKKIEPKENGLSVQYDSILGDISKLIDGARRSTARSVSCVMTAAYWLIGKRIVEFEQSGEKRAEYGTALIERLAADLTKRFGRGFSRQNIQQMRLLYLIYPVKQIRQTMSGEMWQSSQEPICQTMSGESEGMEIPQTVSAESFLSTVTSRFPLPWSAYVRLLSVKNEHARQFYETEALRGGWSIRQLDRQIEPQFLRTYSPKGESA